MRHEGRTTAAPARDARQDPPRTLWNFTNTPKSRSAAYERVVEKQLNPAFGDLTIGEITAERVECYLTQQRNESEVSAKVAREVLGLLMAFAISEGAIASNPAATEKRLEEPKHLGHGHAIEP